MGVAIPREVVLILLLILQFSLLPSNTLSHSSHAINTTPLTKEEDFDGLLEDLARYKLETR